MSTERINVLHVAKVPLTGVWSLITELILAQERGNTVRPYLGVFITDRWLNDKSLAVARMPCKVFTQNFSPRRGGYVPLLFNNHLIKWVAEINKSNESEKLVIHFHDAWMSGLHFPLIRQWPSNVKWVVTIHGVHYHSGLQNVLKKIFYKMLVRIMVSKISSGIFTSVDKSNMQPISSIFDIPQVMLRHIPNGKLSRINPMITNNELKDDKLIVGYVGILSDEKGWTIAVEATKMANAAGIKCKLLLAGPTKCQNEVNNILKNNGHVEYLGVVENAGDVLIPKLDLLLLPSVSEGQPMVIIEAMAAGVPVIATNVGGIPEMINDGSTGFLCKRNAEDFFKAIVALSDLQLRKSFSSCSRIKFDKEFNIESIASNYYSLYSSLFERARDK